MPQSTPKPAASRLRIAASLLLGLLVAAAAVSAFTGVHNAITRSQDFQWSGERLLLHRIDPWQIFLAGNPGNALIGTQVPNYLPILYLLLVPIGLLPMASANLLWACCNLFFAIAAALLAARFYGLRGTFSMIGIVAAMLAATPTRNSISNGQQGLIILALWSAALLWPPAHRPARDPSIPGLLLIGISYLKYSFAPAIAIYLLLRNGLRTGVRLFLWTLLPAAVSTVLLWLWIEQPHNLFTLHRQIVAPLAVAKSGYQPTGDPGQTLMDMLEVQLGGGPVATPRLTLISFAVAVALTVAVFHLAFRYLRRNNLTHTADGFGWTVALMGIMSFAFYKHHPYDEVVFLFPLCHALRHRQRPAAMLALLLIGYHWYIQRLVDSRVHWSATWSDVRLASFIALLACIFLVKPHPAFEESSPSPANSSPSLGNASAGPTHSHISEPMHPAARPTA